MNVNELPIPSIPGIAQEPAVPTVPANHPELFESAWVGSSDQRQIPGLSLVSISPSTTVAPPTAPPPASISATSPAASVPDAFSASSTAPGLDDDDLDEIYFPSTESDPPLTESLEIRQVNTGWLKSHAWSVSVYGGALADKDLVASVKDRGILTPLQVTQTGTVISGHRRLAAAKEARLKTVPVFVGQSKGHRVGGIEEQILEANRHRIKKTPSR